MRSSLEGLIGNLTLAFAGTTRATLGDGNEVPVVAGSGQPLVFRYNTGIIVTWAIDYALELIQANPAGVLLPGAA